MSIKNIDLVLNSNEILNILELVKNEKNKFSKNQIEKILIFDFNDINNDFYDEKVIIYKELINRKDIKLDKEQLNVIMNNLEIKDFIEIDKISHYIFQEDTFNSFIKYFSYDLFGNHLYRNESNDFLNEILERKTTQLTDKEILNLMFNPYSSKSLNIDLVCKWFKREDAKISKPMIELFNFYYSKGYEKFSEILNNKKLIDNAIENEKLIEVVKNIITSYINDNNPNYLKEKFDRMKKEGTYVTFNKKFK